jgi:hypothetical protein
MSELYIPIERPQYNPINGQFLKGHVPHNRGKKMKDYLDEETIKRIKEVGIKNLKSNLKVCGWNKKSIIAMDDDNKILGWFSSSYDAEKKTGICARNIRKTCNGKRKHAGGFKWEFV